MNKKLIGEGIVFGLIIFAVSRFVTLTAQVKSQPSPLAYPTSIVKEVEPPSFLEIPLLNSKLLIEAVGLDSNNRMDIPSDPKNVAWYKFGPLPGQNGNSVIAGHYDGPTGPSVFYNLDKLKAGDTIKVITNSAEILTFEVFDKQLYDDADFPIDTVFGPSLDSNLNLITCAGIYNPKDKNYSKRLVIFTRLKSSH